MYLSSALTSLFIKTSKISELPYLFSIMLEMLSAIKVQPLSDMNQNLAIRTIRIMIAYKASLPAGQRA